MIRVFVLLILAGCLLAGGFWADRALRVFRIQRSEYAPTPYEASPEGRAQLALASERTRQVGWTLSDGTRQVGYFIPPRNGAIVLFAHGSPGNGLGFFEEEGLSLAKRGYGILLIDLPGYGASEGDRLWDAPFIESFRAAVDFALAQPGVDPERIAAFGYSNGGCLVARAAAADERIGALVLLAAYTNLADQLQAAFRRRTPFLGDVAILTARLTGVPVAALDTQAALESMSPRPLLVIWGERDRAIPPSMGPRLKSAVQGAEAKIYPEMGHLDFGRTLGATYIDALDGFLERALGQGGTGPENRVQKGQEPPSSPLLDVPSAVHAGTYPSDPE